MGFDVAHLCAERGELTCVAGAQAGEMASDERAVEAAVLDEDLVGALARYDDAGEVDAGDVAFERCGIADGAAAVGFVEAYAEFFDKAEVWVVAGEREDELVCEDELALGCGE